MGGEKANDATSISARKGSPPRGRGKGPGIQDIVTFRRITPAWAGKSDRRRPSPPGGWDHPRVGGEKLFLVLLGEQRVGSPPRGRGKAVSRTSWRAACGITPAWAGKSSPAGLQCWCRGDHPRVGGEKAVTQTVSKGQVGSPPRGRGKVGAAIMKYTVSGITPAWAGKSMIWLRLSFGCMDHPRVGGEKLQGEVNRQLEAGSPPRGRGKVYSVYREVCYGGITPAWAGKSPGPPGSGLFWGDHPRVGGEKPFV